MRRIAGYVLIVVTIALALITLAQRPPQATAAPVPSDPGRRWEYASLRYNLVKEKWDWISPTENMTEERIRIYHALGGQGRTQSTVSYVDIATQAGQQGWEVVTVLQRDTGSDVWFKRPVR